MKAKILTKNAIKCKKCGDIIQSKYRHNFVSCSCGACSVDGGLDYLRRCGNPSDYEEVDEYKVIEFEPKYKTGDRVRFKYFIFDVEEGVIQSVDVYPNSVNIYYDIFVDSEPKLYKHILEKDIINLVD